MGNLDVKNHVNALGVLCSSQKEDFLISSSSPSILRSNGPNFPGNPTSPTTSSVQIFEPPSSDFEDLGLSGMRVNTMVFQTNCYPAPNKKKRLEISTTRKPLKKAKTTFLKTFEVDSLSKFTAKEQPLEFSAVAASSENVENEYEVEMIIAKRKKFKLREYLVKWRNYGHEANTWQTLPSLAGCKELVEAFNTSLRFNADYTPQPGSFLLGFEFAKCKQTITWLPENIRQFMEILSKDKGPIITVVNEIDEEGPPENFECITELVYAKDVPQPSRSRVKNPCKCITACSDNKSCSCILRNGGIAPYSSAGLIQVLEGMPVYECTSYCGCPPTCKSKVIQQGRRVKIQVFKTKMKGWGVRAMQSIPKGTFVTEYLGEVITDAEAERRGAECDREGLNYLFDLDGGQSESDYTIDGQYKGNVSHFFNHSCDANLVVHPVFVDDHSTSLHRLAFFANRNISYLDELCINYFGTTDMQPSDEPEDLSGKNYDVCQCGAYNCTGKFFK
ncbi:hypothetical protein DSO57_1020443 [Entomophthora muscae]|uniref:Uncharacterized protein n=2 Tax=Entomophthora muscae TaxID=34485 RepID=A0ACC2SGD5_9FUNG|nr:hypothetical protein DSO57_1020443 [Entomophthora muscae]